MELLGKIYVWEQIKFVAWRAVKWSHVAKFYWVSIVINKQICLRRSIVTFSKISMPKSVAYNFQLCRSSTEGNKMSSEVINPATPHLIKNNVNLFIWRNNSQSEFLSHLKNRLHRDYEEGEEGKSQLCKKGSERNLCT